MRVVVLTLALASIITAAAYSSDKVVNYMTYANNVSRNFSNGDNHNTYGWRPCEEAEVTATEVGVVCEGTRSIEFHGSARAIDVNYFCEFQFQKSGETWKVSMALCQ
jgi:hypothetical protein